MKSFIKNLKFIPAIMAVAAIYAGCTKGPEIKNYTYPAPEPKAIFPDSGYANFAEVTITGSRFGDYKNAVKVFFNGIQADTIISCADGKIVVKVPDDAISGKVSLQVWTHMIDSIGSFKIVPPPVVKTANKDIGFPGEIVEITGAGFGADAAKVKVDFNGTTGTITDITDTLLKVSLPQGFSSGNIQVAVNNYPVTGPIFRAFATVPDPIYWLSFEGNLNDNMGGEAARYSYKAEGKDMTYSTGNGSSGQSIKFEGTYNLNSTNNQYLALPRQLTKHPELTVACWVYWTNDSANWKQEPIFDAGLNRGNRLCLMTRMSTGFGDNMVSRLVFEKMGPSNPVNGSAMYYNATGKVLDKKEWHHVALVVSQANKIQRIYVDGVETGSGVIDHPLAEHTIYDHNSVYIGSPIAGSKKEPSLGGMIDEFQIFNQALNADQIFAVYYKHRPQ